VKRVVATALRRPGVTVVTWIIASALLTVIGLDAKQHLSEPTFAIAGSKSAQEITLQRKHFGSSIDFAILLEGPPQELRSQGRHLEAALAAHPDYNVVSPWQRGSDARSLRVARDAALVVLSVGTPVTGNRVRAIDTARSVDEIVRHEVHAPVRAHLTGQATIGAGLEDASLEATKRAELIAFPALLIILLIVFRSAVAAAIPIVVGGVTVSAGFGLLRLATEVVPIDALATTFSSMLGLALGVDYSLLIVSRFREELGDATDRDSVRLAASTAAATAGRTVFFAGALLSAGMLLMVNLLPTGILFSAAVGALLVTILSVASAAWVLPAALVLLGPRVDRGRLAMRRGGPRPRRFWSSAGDGGRWTWVAAGIAIVLLALLTLPALSLQGAAPNADELPTASRQRKDFDEFSRRLGPGWGSPFRITIAAAKGAMTRPALLRRIEAAQIRIARDPDVAYVAGPGTLAASATQLQDVPRRVRSLTAQASKGRRNIAHLHGGLSRIGAGLDQLSGGLLGLRDGTGTAQHGAQRLGTGALAVRDGLRAAQAGAGRGQAGLAAAATGARRLATGIDGLAQGAHRLPGPLGTMRAKVVAGVADAHTLSSGLRSGGGDLNRLRQPVQTADARLHSALTDLRAMTVGKVDPRYVSAVTAVSEASGYITGRDPTSGAQVDPSYDGLDASLARASIASGQAADRVDASIAGTERLASSLDRLQSGATALAAGADRLAASNRLAAGLSQLSRGSAQLPAALSALAGGAGRIAGGQQSQQAGAAQLGSGLDQSAGGVNRLHSGVGRIDRSALAYGSSLPTSRSLNRLGTTQSPGFFRSPYAVLAAVDGAGRDRRAQASFVLDLAGGGQAARILITPDSSLTSPRTRALRDRLDRIASTLNGPATTAFAGGEAAQVLDYQKNTISKLLLLIVLLSAVNYVMLVLVVRSLLVPLFAVLLTLLTVGAAFGALTLLFRGAHPAFGGPGYLDTLALVGTFTVIFALSLDYQMFLIARMREGYALSGSTSFAASYGTRLTAGVILGAACIMIAVFAAFGLSDFATIRQLGVGLSIAIALDATVVRLLLLPALVRLAGKWSWWLPHGLSRRLPRLDFEGPVRATATTGAGGP
jgi:RND superfamily putative drug exporter